MSYRILEGDCLDVLRTLPAESVQTCITSPPYWGLRDYGSEGQLGLEPTPEEYVANLVAVFREVRRVLRDDGTLWLNLGDSYAAQGGSKEAGIYEGKRVSDADWQPARKPTPGLKPKDLVGIPWAVAEALRDPYYTGRIRDERDRIWLAAMIDAEGCIFIHRRKAGQHNGQGYHRKADSFGSGLEVSNTNRRIVERCLEIAQAGSICEQTAGRKQKLYRWNLRTNECREILREVYPYLVAKQHEARLACGVPSSGAKAEAAWEALKAIHQGGERDVDFKPPTPMFEPGYYLRSDIVWNKLNPMPESVTDRPTKAHEYLFLLAKSPRYFYDAEAIREGFADERMGNPGVYNRTPAEVKGVANTRADLGFLNSGGVVGGGGGWNEDGSATGRNKRSVWTVTTQPFPGAHFATFPPKLIEPCVLAGTPPKCCGECGAPWERVVEAESNWDERKAAGARSDNSGRSLAIGDHRHGIGISHDLGMGPRETLGWRSSCEHDDDSGCPTVLDPFNGAGTTGLVALRHNRDYIGIELNPEYAQMARDRIYDDAPLLNVEAA